MGMSAIEQTWLSGYIPWLQFVEVGNFVSNIGMPGIVGASRASDVQTPAQNLPTGGAFIAENDVAEQPSQQVWAIYSEARNVAGCTGTAVNEFEGINLSGNGGSITPYAMVCPGMVVPIWLGSGGSQPYAARPEVPGPAAAAIGVLKNGATFNAGIVFGSDALTGANGTTGTATAVAMGSGHALVWYGPTGAQQVIMLSEQTQPGNAVVVNFADGATALSCEGRPLVQFQNAPPSAGATSMWLCVNDGASGLKFLPVIMGPPNSGGPGVRTLCVPAA